MRAARGTYIVRKEGRTMKKRGCWPLIFCLLLAACGERTQSSVEQWQQRWAQMDGYEAIVEVAVPREDETLRYTLSLTSGNGSVRAAVLAPEELAGVTAVMTGDQLTLEFDGMALDAGTLSPRVSALSCVPLVLDGFSGAYLDSCGSETIDEAETVRADFTMTLGSETLGAALFFDASGAPVYLEVSADEKIIAAAEFTNFAFGDILPPSTQN